MALVFQYGSNTSSERLNSAGRLQGDAVDLGLVRTTGTFDFGFDMWSDANGCAAANIRGGTGRQIWGVLYEVPDYLIESSTSGARKSFDAIEGPKYERRPIKIERADGNAVNGAVITYIVREPEADLKTGFEYVSHILRGLREHRTPQEYIQYVIARILANNPDLKHIQA